MALTDETLLNNQHEQPIKTLNGNSMVSIKAYFDGSIKRESVDLNVLVHKAMDQMSHLDQYDNICFDINIPKNFSIFSNAFLMDVILGNLIQNAVKNNSAHNAIIKINAFKIRKMVVVQIIDNGHGIKNEDQNKVFDLNYGKNKMEAESGKGLYITKTAVERLGGEISLTSYENKFTKFEIKIPIV